MKFNKNVAITFVCLLLGLILAWQFKSVSYNKKVQSESNVRLEELKDELLMEKANNENYRKKIDELQADNAKYQNTLGDIDEVTKKLQEDLLKVQTIAGLTDVKGKGVIITINKTDFSNVVDTDILSVLNELKASDAQAISVNDERIVATSEVRSAGRYIMINGRQMLPPFVIKAIADPDKLEYALKMVGGVVEKLELYQLKVKIDKSNEITIPKVRDDGTVLKTDMLTPVTSK